MNKRGQVTVFVIIGIVLIILLLLFFFLRDRVSLGPPSQQNIEDQFPQIKEHIEECLTELATPRIKQMGLQGGFIDTPADTFRNQQNNKISYLCYDIKDQPYCRSRILRLEDMESELSEYLLQDLQTQCLNIAAFDKPGYDLTRGNLDIKTTISDDNVLIEANLPIKITRGGLQAEESEYSALINVPLGRLHQASRDIVDAESITGIFDTVPYSLLKTQLTSRPYVIQKLQPYPDKLYILKIKDTPSENEEYIFQFFVEGEPR